MTDPQAARVADARRRVKRAGGLLREAAADLAAALSDGPDTLGIVHVTNAHTADTAHALITAARMKADSFDVIILARPGDPTTAGTTGEGDTHGPRSQRR
jgi:hypothetical protein